MKWKRTVCLFLTVVMALSIMTVTADASIITIKQPAKVKATCASAVSAKVSCATVSGAAGYVFYVATKKKGKYSKAADVKTNKAIITGLKTGKTYYFKIKSYSNANKRVYSKFSGTAKCKIVLKKPGLKIIDKCDCKVHLKMTGAPGATGFLVYRSTKKNKGYKLVHKTIGFTYLDTGLKKNTKYFYKIRAYVGNKRTSYTKAKAVKTNKTSAGNGNGSAYSLGNAGTSGYAGALKGHTFLFLGSSITAGKYSGGVSFVEYMDKRNGSKSRKAAVSGTTLARSKIGGSYVERLPKWCNKNSTYDPDVFVCQLSLNDSFKGVPLGSLGGVDFNKLTGDADANKYLSQLYNKGNTVAGAIDYITAYAYNRWPGCQVVFFTVRDVRQFKSYGQQYAKMRSLLFNAQKRYGKRAKDDTRNRIEIIDMWSNSSLTKLKGNTFCLYMNDINHPKKAGYLKQWTPQFEKNLSQWLPTVCTVTWKYEDEDGGKIIKEDKVKRYSRLSYKGNVPVKDEDEGHTYAFTGWKDKKTGVVYTPKELQELTVNGDVTYAAQFKPTTKTFTVTWKDEDDTVLWTSEPVEYGEIIAETDRAEAPPKEGYVFDCWMDAETEERYTSEELDVYLKELQMTRDITLRAVYKKLTEEPGDTSDGQAVDQSEVQNEEQIEEEE